MKILFLFAAFCLFAVSGFSQFSSKMPLVAGDTIVNTGTVSKVQQITTGPSGIIFQVNLTKISGTGAGTVQLYGSLDGVTYTAVGSAFTITNVTTQAAYISVASPLPQYIKVLCTGSGTESVAVQVYYRAPKYQGISTL